MGELAKNSNTAPLENALKQQIQKVSPIFYELFHNKWLNFCTEQQKLQLQITRFSAKVSSLTLALRREQHTRLDLGGAVAEARRELDVLESALGSIDDSQVERMIEEDSDLG